MFTLLRKYKIQVLVLAFMLLSSAFAYSQNKLIAENNPADYTVSTQTAPKVFSNSESPDVLFTVETNVKEKRIRIITNYEETFKIRFIDYYGSSVSLHKNLSSGQPIDVSDYINQILIMNIMDDKNKLLSSQTVNLKRRSYW